jgi:hypothetical protein
MATDRFISFEEAFELLCKKAGVGGRGVQLQPGTMYSSGYDPFAEISFTEEDRAQHGFIERWLGQIGFTGDKFPIAEFERCFDLFPGTPPKPSKVSAAIRDASLVRASLEVPWKPPKELTADILFAYREEPRIRLSIALNLMAFGQPCRPDGLEPIEITTRLRQAAIALFDGPAKKGLVSFMGSPEVKGGDRSDTVPPSYFDMPRNLDTSDDAIYTDLPRLSEASEGPSADWDAAIGGLHQRWFNVRVDGVHFVAWLASQAAFDLACSSPQQAHIGFQMVATGDAIYAFDWESLANALGRVVAIHGNAEQAQTAICGAIADKKIDVRVMISRGDHLCGGRTFGVGNVEVPPRINPADFDWVQSRPVHPWRIGPRMGEHYNWIGGWEPHPIELIELRRADVNAVLRCDTNGVALGAIKSTKPNDARRGQPGGRSKRGRPARDRAAQALLEIFESGVPDQATEPNAELCRKVGNWLKERRLPDVKDDTILRAAGRRK